LNFIQKTISAIQNKGTKPMDIRLIQAGELHELLALYSHLHDKDEPLPQAPVVDAIWQESNLTRGCRSYGVIENVVTHASHRRMGYGKALLAHALRFAWSANCYKVMLLTGRKDAATLQFYESAGFDRHAKQAFVATPNI
jgi:GNAT superfamily N-acetyltransferase